MITDSPGLSSTMSAAARAASVAPDTAMPQSAFFSAGASLTPSPVMPTMWPRCCSTSTMWYLCSGNTWANPSAVSIDSATAADSFFFASPKACGVENVGAQTDLGRGLLRDGQCVAGHHLDGDAHRRRGGDGRCGVVAGRVEQGQHTDELPVAVPVGAGHAQGPEAPGGEIVDRLIGDRFDLRGVGGQRQDDLRGALGDPERGPVGAGDGRPRCVCAPGRRVRSG